jgi:hypothetical protein
VSASIPTLSSHNMGYATTQRHFSTCESQVMRVESISVRTMDLFPLRKGGYTNQQGQLAPSPVTTLFIDTTTSKRASWH